jgi:hypothetical protein
MGLGADIAPSMLLPQRREPSRLQNRKDFQLEGKNQLGFRFKARLRASGWQELNVQSYRVLDTI